MMVRGLVFGGVAVMAGKSLHPKCLQRGSVLTLAGMSGIVGF